MGDEVKERPIEKVKRFKGKRPQTSTSTKSKWPAGEKHVPPFEKETFPGIEGWKPGLGSQAPEPNNSQAKKKIELPKVPPFVEEE